MKIQDLLEEIKLGDEQFRELKVNEDIEEDIEVLEEGARYIRIKSRLDKMTRRMENKIGDMRELLPILSKFKRTANLFESVDKMFLGKIQPSQSQARAKVISLRKNYESIIRSLRDIDIKRMLKEADASVLMGGALGTVLFASKKLEELAKTTNATSLNKRLVPPYLKFDSNFEIRSLKKSENETGSFPTIREDIEENSTIEE